MAIQITESELKLYKSNIPCECKQCKKIFGISKSDAYRVFKGTRKKEFCSRKCTNQYQTQISTKEIFCKNCNTAVTKKLSEISNNNFCSQSCAASYNNRNRAAKHPQITHDCVICGQKTKKNSIKYCSIKCQHQHYRDEKIKEWLNGNFSNAITGKTLQIKPFIRNYLKDKALNKCSKCGWNDINPVTKRCPLEINHIDGNPLNNDILNLEVLCPNCHALTPNFRALNKNSPRQRK